MHLCRRHSLKLGLAVAVALVEPLLLGALAVACGPLPVPESREGSEGSVVTDSYEQRPATARGTGRIYLGREIAIPVSHAAAGWLERPEREEEEKPRVLVDALGLQPDDVVADVGAGTGYYTFRLAARVPRGKVLVIDVDPGLLAELRAAAARRGVDNVEPVLGDVDDPRLPTAAVDLALIVDAYHEFSHPREMMAAIVRALAPGGRVALVEYRAEDPDLPIHPLHRMSAAQARREMEAAGLVLLATRDHLPRQHLMFFGRPAAPEVR